MMDAGDVGCDIVWVDGVLFCFHGDDVSFCVQHAHVKYDVLFIILCDTVGAQDHCIMCVFGINGDKTFLVHEFVGEAFFELSVKGCRSGCHDGKNIGCFCVLYDGICQCIRNQFP